MYCRCLKMQSSIRNYKNLKFNYEHNREPVNVCHRRLFKGPKLEFIFEKKKKEMYIVKQYINKKIKK